MQSRNARVALATHPLTARSVLASALLGMDPPELPVAQLVRLTGLFGISENRARVALSRMVAAGEVTTDGSGGYRLSGHLVARQARQSASRSGATVPYDGSWWLAVVTTSGSTAEVRGARRRALAYARLAELRDGVWMRPANVALALPDSLDADVEIMAARARRRAEPRRPVVGHAHLGGPRRGATACARCALARPPRGAGAGIRALGRGLASPPERPAAARRAAARPGWPGAALRTAYDDWDSRYRATLRDWSRT